MKTGRGRGIDKVSPEAYETRKRHRRWLRLRLEQGLTYRAIAAREGVASSTVEEALKRRMGEVTGVPARELVEIELGRLEELYKSVRKPAIGLARLVQRAERGEIDADDLPDLVDVALRANEQARKVLADKRKMLGLEAPKQLVVSAVEGNEAAARAVLSRPSGQVRDVILEALRNPSHEWRLLLAEAGYRSTEVVESSGVTVETSSARLIALADEMLGGGSE